MLRAKQLTTLTNCARSFYLTGSRNTVDGSASTCSEDDSTNPNFISKRESQSKTNANFNSANPNFNSTSSNFNSSSRFDNNKPYEPAIVNTNNGGNNNNSAKYYIKPSVQNTGVFSEILGTGTGTVKYIAQNVQVPKETGTVTGTVNSSPINFPSNNNNNNYNNNNKSLSNNKPTQNKPNIPKTQSHSPVSNIKNNIPNQNDIKPSNIYAPKSKLETQERVKIPSNTFNKPTYEKTPKNMNYTSKPTKKTFNNNYYNNNHRSSMNQVRAVEQYYHTLQQIKWGPLAENALDSIQCKLDAFQCNQVLKLLKNNHLVAFGFFKWLKKQPGFKHDCHTYTTMIGILGQNKELNLMRNLLEEMVTDRCHPSVVTYNRLIHAYGKCNYINEAMRIFNEMGQTGIEPDRVTYCTLIDIHAKAGYLETAMDLYNKMQETGLLMDTFTYSVMINCLGKAGHLAAAYRLFNEMVQNGCVPNIVTYNTIIALQAKARNYTSVVKLYNDMQKAGFKPDKITYSIVIEVLGQNGHLEETEKVFSEMQLDFVPDEPVYGLLVDLWGKNGNVDKAKYWYQLMLKDGLRPNVPTCNSLLSAFLRAKRFNDAYFVLQNMISIGLVPSLQTYTLLLSSCTDDNDNNNNNNNNNNKGLYCQLMAITQHPAHSFLFYLPDADINGLNIKNHANYFLDLMHSEDRESKRGLIDAIIDFLHRSGLKEEAGFIWEIAMRKNIYPDSIKEKRLNYWLINLHLMSEGTAVIALSRTLAWFHRRIRVSGLGPERIDIVTGWGRRSRVTGASLVRRSVESLLSLFEFPFFRVDGNNSGCFVGCGESLNNWLANSFVERMHLL